ncbi:hypothetical protein NET02_05880 [Thermomicrobiaceae bacterium CFH 74404]|uniref:Cupin domain-containing protein n=1 Tax=Thermalbibacter longus TaxID=2951981 RepID=A0AA42BCD8_9BACT|nr:hypothetical protein [Thermalbibacter longus]MCM8748668.1 hypothetical protein [Thermalbibacter longus]
MPRWGPGALVLKPRGIPHAFWNEGPQPARLLEIISPAGFERYFEDLAERIPADGPPDVAQLAALWEKYSLEMDMDSVAQIAERYHVRLM